MLTISASSAVLNTNEIMPCAVAVRRMVLSVTPTSETCAVMPITNEEIHKVPVIGVIVLVPAWKLQASGRRGNSHGSLQPQHRGLGDGRSPARRPPVRP